MSGETNLDILLKSMSPHLNEDEFVFVSIENGRYGQLGELAPIAMFIEDEGMTLVVPKATADDNGFSYDSTFCCITLTIHSSLDAVGLTAAFASKLAEKDISANVIAGYYHDHIFVQSEKSEQAMSALNEFRK